MQPHPEGGFYKEVYRAKGTLPTDALPTDYLGPRNYATSIYFMLTRQAFSAYHRLRSDELWYYHTGAPVSLFCIDAQGQLQETVLGPNPEQGQVFCALIPAGTWFAARLTEQEGPDFMLMSCAVAPGFDFADFELAQRQDLVQRYPHLAAHIRSLTH